MCFWCISVMYVFLRCVLAPPCDGWLTLLLASGLFDSCCSENELVCFRVCSTCSLGCFHERTSALHGLCFVFPAGSRIVYPRKELSQRNVPAESRVPTESRVAADQWLLSVRTEFKERVSSPVLKDLLDKLLESRVIIGSEMESVKAKSRNDGALEVLDVVQKKGAAASSVLINALRELDPYLYRELNSS